MMLLAFYAPKSIWCFRSVFLLTEDKSRKYYQNLSMPQSNSMEISAILNTPRKYITTEAEPSQWVTNIRQQSLKKADSPQVSSSLHYVLISLGKRPTCPIAFRRGRRVKGNFSFKKTRKANEKRENWKGGNHRIFCLSPHMLRPPKTCIESCGTVLQTSGRSQ